MVLISSARLSALLLSFALVPGGLQPDEIVIVAMRSSPESRQIAAYYAKARDIPHSHICLLSGEPGASVSRNEWEGGMRPAIVRWLVKNELEATTRCLVTTWDVPLTIGRLPADHLMLAARSDFLKIEWQRRWNEVCNEIGEMDGVLAEGQPAQRALPVAETGDLKTLVSEFQLALRDADERRKLLTDAQKNRQVAATLEKIVVRLGGPVSMLRSLAKNKNQIQTSQDAAQKLLVLQGQIMGLQIGKQAVEALPESVVRDEQILAIVEQASGLVGTLQWIENERKLIDKNESYASFDSELSLLFWPDYPRLRWQPNVLNHAYDDKPTYRRRTTLMVSRLEAPTLELTKSIVDTAIKIERTGLAGNFYVDARGLRASASFGSTGYYDEALRSLASFVKDDTKIPVTLNNTPDLFQPGSCPDAALYCGWYSLAKYVDAFDWNEGSVAYHMASGEAVTLRKPESEVWCKRMLEDGVCATLGPVREPYLAAFPPPDQFFALLLTGRYTLAEAYYRTKPFNSWVMVLVGDPLYTPFKRMPALAEDSLPAGLRRKPQ